MKAMNKLIAGAMLSMAVTGIASAAEMTTEQVFDATKLAVADFTVAQPTHAEHIYGFKSWKSDDDARVIIYVKHDGMTMNYNYQCHIHENGPECHAQ